MEDRFIFALLWNRTASAIDVLAKAYGARLYRTAMNLLGTREDTEKAVRCRSQTLKNFFQYATLALPK